MVHYIIECTIGTILCLIMSTMILYIPTIIIISLIKFDFNDDIKFRESIYLSIIIDIIISIIILSTLYIHESYFSDHTVFYNMHKMRREKSDPRS